MGRVAGTDTVADLVGRTFELSRIGEMVHRLAAGRGSLILLLGEAGMGRTSLLHEAITMAGHEVPRVRAVHVPAGILSPDSVPAMSTILSASTAAAPTTDVLAGALGESDRLDLESPELLEAAVAVVRAETAERPLIVTLDDLPFQDETALRALTSLAAAIATMPIMVVITCRDMPSRAYESSPVGPLWVHRLDPLTLEDSVALVRRVAGAHVPRSVAASLGRLTGGNPGDIEELCGLLDDAQLSGMEPLPDPLPGTRVSAAVHGSWWAGLGRDDRLLVLRAALAIVPELVFHSAPKTASTLTVRSPDGVPAFDQAGDGPVFHTPRVASAVLALTPMAEIREAHAALSSTATEGTPERHWHQLLAGGAPTPEAVLALADLAENAFNRGDLALAQRVAAGAGKIVAPHAVPTALLMVGGLAALYSGLPGTAVTLLADAAAAATDAVEEYQALAALTLARTYRDCALPVAVADAAISRLESRTPARAASLACLVARLAVHHGDRGAPSYLARAESLSVRAGEPASAVAVAAGAGCLARELAVTRNLVRHASGDESPALEPVPAEPWTTLVSRRPGADVVGWTLALDHVAMLLQMGAWDEARAAISDIRSQLRQFPAPLLAAGVAVLATRLHLALWEVQRADEIAGGATLPLHLPFGGTGPCLMAEVADLRGRGDEAMEWLADASSRVQQCGGPPSQAGALAAAQGVHAWLEGHDEEAVEALDRATSAGATGGAPITALVLADAYRRLGDGPTWDRREARLSYRTTAGDAQDGIGAALDDLLRAADSDVVAQVAHAATTAQRTLSAGQEAVALHIMALRLGGLGVAAHADQVAALGDASIPGDRDEHRQRLLLRARERYRASGAVALAARADRELTRLRRSGRTLAQLSPQEREIADMVREGASNKQIASALYLSVRTVELRLTTLYRKLGIRSRRELRDIPSIEATLER